jgi:hypothetical protein
VGPFETAAVIAHAGGWDEILIPVAILGYLGYWLLRKRPQDGSDSEAAQPVSAPSACAYCGARVPAGQERCPSCGFRLRPPKA